MQVNKLNLHSVSRNNQISFKAFVFSEYNSKYSEIRPTLKDEIDKFILYGSNTEKIGEGVSGETFRFNKPALSGLVLKQSKPGTQDKYDKEYSNLMLIPTDKIGGQEAVARGYDSDTNKYYLVSTLVSGKNASRSMRYNEKSLNSLFNKMFELDKMGIYHGDLNGKNIMINSNNEVNFIDYQWTQQVSTANFFDRIKTDKTLLPATSFPENAQMFEMASMPWYIDSFSTQSEKIEFLKLYLQAKSKYHENRYNLIRKITENWPYQGEMTTIADSLKFEKAKSKVYATPDDDILKIELKKFQFLSDYRDAFANVDVNLPNRNILGAPAGYLCAISAVQDFRKTVRKALNSSIDDNKTDYLKAMSAYGDYWYQNLLNYTYDTYKYIMRTISKKYLPEETVHEFYINERNPRHFKPNRDILGVLTSDYQPEYRTNFFVPSGIKETLGTIYSRGESELSDLSTDTKSSHNLEKIAGFHKKSKKFLDNHRYLDLLNLSELASLKLREFRSHVKHKVYAPTAERRLAKLTEDSFETTDSLFNGMYTGLKDSSPEYMSIPGYNGMRKFENM